MARININIIERNITGHATSDEQEILHSWLAQNEANRDAYFRMKNIWDSCRIKGYSQNDIRREWELLAKRLKTVDLPAAPVRKYRVIRVWMRYAAVFVVAAGLTWAVVSVLQPRGAAEQPPVSYQQFTVPNGQRTQVILADGSRVWLNAGTTLKYPSDFGVRNRQVVLDGEAGFMVTPSDIPFTVTADKVEITVLGTHFNVRNYATDDYVETTLFEGSVKMHVLQNTFMMKPGEVATYQKGTQLANVSKAPDIANKQAWNNNQLVINGERLEDIAHTLERWYDVKITIADDELKNYRYTGKFVYNEDIRQVMKVISVTTAIRYTIEGNQIEIRRK